MTEPIDPYRPPAADLTEAPVGDALPGLRGMIIAVIAMAVRFGADMVLGWSGFGILFGGAAAVAATQGFAVGLRGLNAELPPRAGRPVTLVIVAFNGVIGALGALMALVSLAASLGGFFDYTND